jgi:5'-3' exonuclease
MRLHLVDGTYELFRAHFSRGPSRSAPDGRDVKAAVGTVRQVMALLDDANEECTHVAVAFDNPIESFRNRLFTGYKDGSGTDPSLLAQFDLVEAGIRALGVTVWSMADVEADDAMASAAVRFAADVDQVRILTPDKDLGQVVDGERIVQIDRARDRCYDAAGVEARLGVPPSAVVDHLALVGDTADGIPGVPGIGAKTSALLLQRYSSIAEIPSDHEEWDITVRGAARIAEVLRTHAAEIALWRTLATLVTDVELGCELAQLRWRGVNRPALDAWADTVGSGTVAGWRR